ncbi:MAG: YicC/YloC family endoribonuclease [Sphaerochaetaceae bacterium]
MISMTGYGYSEAQNEHVHLSVELKSYNNRFLDISVNLPPSLGSLEQSFVSRLKKEIQRGSVELIIRVRTLRSDLALHVDEGALAAYKEACETIQKLTQSQQSVGLEYYLSNENIVIAVKERDTSLYEELLQKAFEHALRQLLASKQQEGEHTLVTMKHFVDELIHSLEYIEQRATSLEEYLKESLLKRFDQLLESKEVDENRFYQEVALLVNKYTISEELVRLRSHISSFKELLESSEAIGKRLDFICQEMNREINTIGSKSTMVEVSQHVVRMKDYVENLREQVRNVE